jgi:hypothetical protein
MSKKLDRSGGEAPGSAQGARRATGQQLQALVGQQLQALVELNPPLADRETEQKRALI